MIIKAEDIKYVFNPAKLIPGDILLMNTYAESLRRHMKQPRFEHAAIYVGDAQIMEANGAHDIITHVLSYAFKEKDHLCVLRPKNVPMHIMESAAMYARGYMGRNYIDNMRDLVEARTLKESSKNDESNRSFCSRLVAQVYEDAEFPIVPNCDYCEPDDFLKSEVLEEVPDGIMPFSEDIARVVMNQQAIRDKNDCDSPNAELFKSMSELYGRDVQTLGQGIKASLEFPGHDEECIEIIKSSRMFKHKKDVENASPWLLDEELFFNHFKDNIEDALHCLYSQMNRYDKTFIKDYRQLLAQVSWHSSQRPNSKVLQFLKDYITNMVDEAIECRKLLALFYKRTRERFPEEFKKFTDEYGEYDEWEYKPTPLDISFLLKDVLKTLL